MNLTGIRRDHKYSPNSEDRDAAIIQSVAIQLHTDYGHNICLVDERQLTFSMLSKTDAIFSMARSPKALKVLAEAERHGIPVFNSTHGVKHLSRRTVNSTCKMLQIAVPSLLTELDFSKNSTPVTFPCWLKRDDECAQQANDIHFIPDEEALQPALQDFRSRHIHQFVIEKHLTGDVLKFYGVSGTPFFHCHYPIGKNGFSKFGLEHINGKTQGFAFDHDKLKQQTDKTGTALGIPIYGGDAIVDADGTCHIIDFNDWPSYSACREEAAQAIAGLIHSHCTRTIHSQLH